MEKFDAKLEEITKKLIEGYKPEKIILFGSRAWGEPNADSDYDLFVVKDENKDPLTMMQEARIVLIGSMVAIDVLVYTPNQVQERKRIGDPFVKKVLAAGKVLYDTRQG